ncbi:MAG: hypothetical protein DWQ11_03255 [Proteobacteria bacterium]|nr:MAG: hypothetical protein DWQ11_03255 [Pseudomonadota bacterium]
MHKSLNTLAAIALSLSLATPAIARTPVPIVDHHHVSWSQNANGALDTAGVRDRIIEACQAAGWSVVPGNAPDTLVATLVVRNKHTIRTNIAYTTDTFSITYHGSINMNYAVKEPDPYGVTPTVDAVQVRTEVIHPHYNRWVSTLLGAIRTRLAQ